MRRVPLRVLMEGFVYPGCGGSRARLLKSRAFTYECADCGRQTSVTTGTILHAGTLPLTMWFWAAFFVGEAFPGISALQLQNQLGLGSERIGWMLCVKSGQRNVRRHRAERDRVVPKALIGGPVTVTSPV